jgi:hypothetical protein
MKALETEYSEILFRSRLEARWAILFDTLKLEWVYEPECFILSNNQKYTPDFYIKKYDLYIEIKPTFEWIENQYHLNRYKLFEKKLLVLSGDFPNFNENYLFDNEIEGNNIGVIFCPFSKHEPFYYTGSSIEDQYNLDDSDYYGYNEDYKKEIAIVKKYRFY